MQKILIHFKIKLKCDNILMRLDYFMYKQYKN